VDWNYMTHVRGLDRLMLRLLDARSIDEPGS
jgi:hypothetical protein